MYLILDVIRDQVTADEPVQKQLDAELEAEPQRFAEPVLLRNLPSI